MRRPTPAALSIRLTAGVLAVLTALSCARQPRLETAPLRTAVVAPEAPGVRLPTEPCGGFFIVEATLDGRGPYRLVLDTGASSTVLSPAAAREVGIVRQARIVEAGEFRVTGRIPVLERDLAPLSRALGTDIDGILGYDVFEGRLLIYDYPNREVRVAEGRLRAGEPGVVPLSSNRRPRIGARLGARKLNLLVDTGFAGGLALGGFDALDFDAPPVPVGARVRIDGLHLRHAGRLVDDLVLGAFVLERPIAVNAVGDALLGQEILRSMRVTLDRASGLARFVGPDGDWPGTLRVPSLFGNGIAARPGSDRYDVVQVFPGTPADREGLAEGDAIVAIDGVRVADRGCADPGGDPRAPTVLTVLRDGVERDVALVPEALVP